MSAAEELGSGGTAGIFEGRGRFLLCGRTPCDVLKASVLAAFLKSATVVGFGSGAAVGGAVAVDGVIVRASGNAPSPGTASSELTEITPSFSSGCSPLCF